MFKLTIGDTCAKDKIDVGKFQREILESLNIVEFKSTASNACAITPYSGYWYARQYKNLHGVGKKSTDTPKKDLVLHSSQ